MGVSTPFFTVDYCEMLSKIESFASSVDPLSTPSERGLGFTF